MKPSELKLNLHQLIDNISDDTILESVYQLLSKVSGKDKNYKIPQWQINEVNDRLAEYKKDTSIALDFNDAINDIEKDL